jgi:hypothetical protein
MGPGIRMIHHQQMNEFDAFRERFISGLRGVPDYIGSVCHHCAGSCGDQLDDQCLISAWSSYIQAAFDHGHDAYEAGKRCATAQLRHRERHNEVRYPCETGNG